MSGLLICAAAGAGFLGRTVASASGRAFSEGNRRAARAGHLVSYALIALALWLAYAAGGA